MTKEQTVNVLVVDDDSIDREICIRYLSQIHTTRYQLSEVDNLQDAIAYQRAGIANVIILDYSLPDGTGLDFIEAIKENDGTINTPIIMLTGMGSEKLAVEAIKAGAKNYLPKDKITPKTLHTTIQEALENNIDQLTPITAGHQKEAHCAVPPQNWIRI